MKCNKKDKACVIGFKDVWLRLIGIPVIGLILPFIFFELNPILEPKKYFLFVFVSIVYTSIYWHIDRGIIIFFRKKIPDDKLYKKRLTLQSIVVVIATISLCSVIELILSVPLSKIDFDASKVPFFLALVVSFVITIIIISIYEAWYAFDLYKMELVRNESLKKENAQAQLQTLKNQINPHFLFNSLNTLVSVIPENQDLAVEFAENLSKVYRYILQIKDKDFVVVADELKCIDAYEYLLKIRFGDNIIFKRKGFNGNKNLFLIPLSIQTLIENAVKHNIVSKSKPLSILISATDTNISVQNNLQLKSSVNSSTKTGLLNIKKRFELLTNKTIQINKTEEVFEVIIPLVNIGTAL